MAKTEMLKTLDFCAIDTETTGVVAGKDEMLEIALVRFRNGRPARMFHTLLRPKSGEVPWFITKITGIRTEDVINQPRVDQIADQAKAFIEDDIIVGQNTMFDVHFLEADDIGPIKLPVVDTMRIARKVYPDLPNHKLGTIIEKCASEGMEIRKGNAHRADWDAIMTGYCYVHMLPKIED